MRPPRKNGDPTRVYFHVTVMGIDSINENSMTYAADIFFAQTWKDHRLRLPENMTSEYRLLEVEWLNEMWRPDSYFKNAKQVTFQTVTIPNHYVWLYRSKMILYMVKLTLTLSCAMNYAVYPHDTQECKLQIESLSHTTEDLIFEWEHEVPLVVDENIELPQFDLVRNTTDDCTQVYSTGNFTCLEVVFTLKRRLGYYLFHTYMPTCLIVIMSWISFWIKPEAAPARVTLGVTSLLTLSTQHAKSQASLPPVSYIKIIDMFMNTCTIFVFLALMEYALVNVVLGDGPDAPPILKRSIAGTCVGGKKQSQHSQGRAGKHGKKPTTQDEGEAVPAMLAESSHLVCLARQFRLSQSASDDHSSSSSTQEPHCNSSGTSASHSEVRPTTFPANQRSHAAAHTVSPLTYKCGHQVKESHPQYLSSVGIYTSGSPRSSLMSGTSYPHLPDCEVLHKPTPHRHIEVNIQRQHSHPHCRSSSVGLNLKGAAPFEADNSAQATPDPMYRKSSLREDALETKITRKSLSFREPSVTTRSALRKTELSFRLDADVKNLMESRGVQVESDLPRSVPPPPPPPATLQLQSHAQTAAMAHRRRAKAIVVDRFSRVFFPLTFGLINFIYWIAFWSYL